MSDSSWAAIMNSTDWAPYEEQTFLAHSSGGWEFPGQGHHGHVLVKTLFLGRSRQSLPASLKGSPTAAALGVLMGATIPFTRAPPLGPDHLPNAPPPQTVAFGV